MHHAYPTRHLESRGQALATFGKHAKHAASDLAFGKKVTLQTFGKNKYGRTIADVILSDGLSLNQELVKQGWWWYRKYAPRDMVLERLEKEAREGRKSLWADPQPVPRGSGENWPDDIRL